jgi:hypothetical protein
VGRFGAHGRVALGHLGVSPEWHHFSDPFAAAEAAAASGQLGGDHRGQHGSTSPAMATSRWRCGTEGRRDDVVTKPFNPAELLVSVREPSQRSADAKAAHGRSRGNRCSVPDADAFARPRS